MFFEYPHLLWLLVIPALLIVHYIYLELCGRRPHLRVSDIRYWKAGGKSVLSYLRHAPMLLRTVALSMIIIAIARPRSSSKMDKIDTEGIDIVLAMDVSTSMLARDFTPDRISAAKDIAIEFISQRPSDRIGIVVFAGESYTPCDIDKPHEGDSDRTYRGWNGDRKRTCYGRGQDAGVGCEEPCCHSSY